MGLGRGLRRPPPQEGYGITYFLMSLPLFHLIIHLIISVSSDVVKIAATTALAASTAAATSAGGVSFVLSYIDNSRYMAIEQSMLHMYRLELEREKEKNRPSTEKTTDAKPPPASKVISKSFAL